MRMTGQKGSIMKFWKMNGAGNDFIIIDNRTEKLPEEKLPEIIRTVCERHLSLGADGVMLVEAPDSPGADVKMRYFNSDGSAGEMCGNGARCICRYAFETGLAGETQVIETTAGLVSGQRLDARNYRIRLNDPSVLDTERVVKVDGQPCQAAYVELGDPGIPHTVVPVAGLAQAAPETLRELGALLRYHKDFPKGANVNFYEITGEDEVLLLTYERGVEDFTYACGTGTGSTAAVLAVKGLISGRGTRFKMRGGELRMDVVRGADGRITDLFLTGPTNIVAKGEITDEEL